MNELAGTWTYRSFFDLPVVDKFEDLRFAEAELTLVEGETADLLTGRLSFGQAYLEIIVFVTKEDGRQAIRMRATGVKGTATEGWVYDYIGNLTASWEHGDNQRRALVGTVIRTAPHEPKRSAGFSASFIAVHRTEPPPAYKLPAPIIEHFGSRLHRLHHAAWHAIRNGWDLMSPDMREAVSDLDWASPRPARAFGKDGTFFRPHIANGSGEDFLFMHRQMVVGYKELMHQAGEMPVEWTLIPEPGDSDHPVPPIWPLLGGGAFERRLAALKSDTHYWSQMRWWDQQFKDPTYLSTLTLGEFGSLIEFSVHNDMHMRWSAAPRDPTTNAILPFGRPYFDFTAKWDSPAYDWLGDFYGNQINPYFWRLHGWIDDRIEDWFAAHDQRHNGEIKRVMKGGVSWFKPGQWVLVDKPWVWPDTLGGFENAHGGHQGAHADHDGGGHGGHHHGSHGGTDADKLASLETLVTILYPRPTLSPTLSVGTDGSISPALARALSSVVGLSDMRANTLKER